MKQPGFRSRLRWSAGIGLILLLVGSCQISENQPASPRTTASNASGLAPDEIATLNSLEQVDDYPLYVLHYTGEYCSELSDVPVKTTAAAWG